MSARQIFPGMSDATAAMDTAVDRLASTEASALTLAVPDVSLELVRLSEAIEGVQCWAGAFEEECDKRLCSDANQRERIRRIFDNYRTRMECDGGVMDRFDRLLVTLTGTDRLPVIGG